MERGGSVLPGINCLRLDRTGSGDAKRFRFPLTLPLCHRLTSISITPCSHHLLIFLWFLHTTYGFKPRYYRRRSCGPYPSGPVVSSKSGGGEKLCQHSLGSRPMWAQRSLIPDLILEMDDVAVIVDAKYKRHWEELQEYDWRGQDDDLREQHRADLLQILAYANLVSTKQVVCCLVYPCATPTWESLALRGRLVHCSELPNRGRRIQVWLTALPMSAARDCTAAPLSEKLRSARRIQ